MNVKEHSDVYPLNYKFEEMKKIEKDIFVIDSFFPLCNVSHGKLQIWEKLLTLEIFAISARIVTPKLFHVDRSSGQVLLN